MMIKRRIDEDFKHVWAINWNGLPEDFSDATEIVLTASVYGKKKQLERGIDYVIKDNLIIVDFTPRFATITGIYNLELKYIKPSDGFIDGERRSAIDLDVVQIVARSSQVTDTGDITSTSEAAFGFQGLSAYEVWLKDNPGKTKEDYFNWLQKPATDIVETVNLQEQARVDAEELRVLAESERIQAENERLSAEIIRQSNEDNRIENEAIRVQNEAERISKENVRQSNEIDRVEAEDVREQAENERAQAEVERQITIQEAITATNLANEKANLANAAAQSANEAADSALTATQEATTAASLADTARLSIQDDLALKANHGYESNPKTLKEVDDEKADQADLAQLESEVKDTTEKPTAQSIAELNARITALEAIITNRIKDKIEVTKEFNVWGKTNLILYGTGANTKAPDFIGQKYIDTAGGNVYIAVGTTNAGNWKLV